MCAVLSAKKFSVQNQWGDDVELKAIVNRGKLRDCFLDNTSLAYRPQAGLI